MKNATRKHGHGEGFDPHHFGFRKLKVILLEQVALAPDVYGLSLMEIICPIGKHVSTKCSRGYSYCVIIFCRLYVAGLVPQQGHRGRVLISTLINRTRTVAIEFGMWRSGRK